MLKSLARLSNILFYCYLGHLIKVSAKAFLTVKLKFWLKEIPDQHIYFIYI